jgi:HPt (histidine-containing phosphotransfer) domain-containing protein
LDTDRALEVTGGNAKILKRVTGVFLDNVPQEVEQLGAAIAKGRQEESNRLAHSIKGAAASVGGVSVSQRAFDMERAAQKGNLDLAQSLFEQFKQECERLYEALRIVDWDEAAARSAGSRASVLKPTR